MLYLILGLVIFLGVHSVEIVSPTFRSRAVARFGEMPYKGISSLLSIIGFVLAYALVCAAAPVFLARIGELTARAVVLSVVPLAGLLCVLGFYVTATLRDNATGLLWAVGVIAAVVIAGWVRLGRHPRVAARVGVHDWPTDADCIDGPART